MACDFLPAGRRQVADHPLEIIKFRTVGDQQRVGSINDDEIAQPQCDRQSLGTMHKHVSHDLNSA